MALRTSVNDEREAHRLYEAFIERLPRTRSWLTAVTANDPLVHLDGSLGSLDALAAWFERSLDTGTLPIPDAPAIYGTGDVGGARVRRILHDAAVTGGFERRPLTTDRQVLRSAEAFTEALGGYLAEVCRKTEPKLTWALNPRPGVWGLGMPVLIEPSEAPLPLEDMLRPVQPLDAAGLYVAPVLDGTRRPVHLRDRTCTELRRYGVDDTFSEEPRTAPTRPYRLPWWARHDQNLQSLVRIYHPPPEPAPEVWEDDLVAAERMDEWRWSHEVTVNDEIAHNDDLMAAFRRHLRRQRRVRRVAHVDREVFLVHAPRLPTAKLGAAAAEWLHHRTDHR